MTGLLLVDIMPIAIGAGCGVGALSLLYGVFKKCSRMSWAVWDILILFAFSFILDAVSGSGLLVFLFTAIGFFLILAALHAAEAFLKQKLEESEKSSIRLLDRLLGALTSVMGIVLFALAAGGFALLAVYYCAMPELELFQASVWTDFLAKHVLDLSLIAVFVGAFKGGYRLGLIKSLWGLFGIAATGGIFIGSLAMAMRVGFLKSLGSKIAGTMSGMGEGVAALLGTLIVAAICFVVLFAVLVALFVLINWLVKKLNRNTLFNVIDGTLLAVILFVITALIVSAGHFGIYMLAENAEGWLGEAGSSFAVYLEQVGEMLSSSPLSRVFYEFNPLRLLFG